MIIGKSTKLWKEGEKELVEDGEARQEGGEDG